MPECVCSSEKSILDVPHSSLLRNENWFGNQQAQATCARWTMWNAWLILPVLCCHVQHPVAATASSLFVPFSIHKQHLLLAFLLPRCAFSLFSKLTLKTQKILLYFWLAGMVSHLFLVVEMTGLPCVRRFGIYQNDEKGYNEKTLLMSSRALQLIRSFWI